MATSSTSKPVIAVIGGSGLYSLGLKVEREIDITTEVPGWPFGPTSSPIVIAALPSGQTLAFIARHGFGHTLLPSEIPNKANIAALKHLGCQAIVAFSAVGSLREEIKPRDLVLPDQIIDRTKGIRDSTYFGSGVVAHAMFGEPFDKALVDMLAPLVRRALESNSVKDVTVHEGKALLVMEGPAFSTRAESNWYRAAGADIIGMTTIPESKLAREAEMSYALVATSTDYDAWRQSEEPVTVAEVLATLKQNSDVSKLVTVSVLADIHDAVAAGKLSSLRGSMQYSIMGKPADHNPKTRKTLSFVLPEYFSN